MYKLVLAPLDGSERAEIILAHVKDVAQCYGAKVILMGVLEPPHTIVAPDGIYIPSQDIIQERRREMEAYLKSKQAELNELGIETDIRISYGRVIDEIIETAEREEVDLVAMTSHGRTGLSRVFYGSVAAGVLHRIDRPLLLVRAT